MERPIEYEEDPPPPDLDTMWGMEAATECDCPGPPPEFMLPPPPRPPILQPSDPMYCTEEPLPIETCDAQPVSKNYAIFEFYEPNNSKTIKFFLNGDYNKRKTTLFLTS